MIRLPVLIIITCFSFFQSTTSWATQPAPIAVFTKTSEEFGKIEQGTKLEVIYSVRNEGNAPLIIERAELSEPNMKIRFKRKISPGEEGKITVIWDTQGRRRMVEGQITVFLNDPKQPVYKLTLQGEVVPPVDIFPYPAVFLSVFQGDKGERKLTFVNNQSHPVIITELSAGTNYSAVLKPIEKGKVYEILVNSNQNGSPGRHREMMELKTDKESVSYKIPINILIKTEIYANPESVDLDHIDLDQLNQNPGMADFLTQTFFVKKRKGKFNITSIQSNIPFLTIKQTPQEPSQAFQVDVGVDLKHLKPGKIEDAIIVKTDDDQFQEFKIPVKGIVTQSR